jgi:hypothetical protein
MENLTWKILCKFKWKFKWQNLNAKFNMENLNAKFKWKFYANLNGKI